MKFSQNRLAIHQIVVNFKRVGCPHLKISPPPMQVILFWRGVWNSWDALFGTDSLASNLGSMAVGLIIMSVIRILDLPLVQGLPGG